MAGLAARGVAWPAPLHYLATTTSTSDWLKERARSGAAVEWTAVLAGRQTAGRGRQGHGWVSPAGNLFLSVLLRPRLAPECVTAVPLATGVAVAEAAEELGAVVRLKWPNDLMADDLKLGGILAEGFSAGPGLDGLVVGVGLNLDLSESALPEELRGRVTSVRALTGRAPAVEEAAAAVLSRLFDWYHALAREGPDRALEEWRRRSLPWWGRPVEARSGGSILRGIARGIDGRGALILETEGGKRVAIVAGEVREVRLSAPEP